jgi:hypothetical protein
MAIRKPYGPNDLFATPAEARSETATVTEIPLSSYEDRLERPKVQQLLKDAAALSVDTPGPRPTASG